MSLEVLKLFKAVINEVGVFVNEDNFIDSWRREWTSLRIHRQPRRGKHSFWWSTGSWNGQYCSGEQWQPGIDIFLWVPPSQNIIRCNRQTSIQLNFSISLVPVEWTCFDNRSCLAFFHGTGDWTNHCWMLPRSFIPLALLLACSPPVYLSIARDSKWKVSCATKKSWTTYVKLR